MAKSGAFSTSNEYIKYTIEVIQNSQSVANNASSVTVKVRFYRTNTGYETYGSGTVYCKINGTQYSASVSSSQKITSSGIELFTKTLNIPHNADGTKTLACSAWISHSRVTSSEQSYSVALTTIPRKSTLTVANGTLGTAQALKVTRQSTAFSHSIKVVCGSITRYIKADGTLSTTEVKHTDCDISFTPPLDWASQNTTDEKVSVTYTLTTYNGSASVGSNPYTKSCAIPESVAPSVSVATSEATGITIGMYFRYVSQVRFLITATPAYGSPIASYKTTIDGKTYTAGTFTTENLKSSGTVNYTTVVTDKRGRSTTYNGAITVNPYVMPSVKNLTVARCNSDGTPNQKGEYAKVSFGFSAYNMPLINYVYVKTQYKKKADANYTLIEEKQYDQLQNGGGSESYIFAADTSSVYDVQIEITDTVCTSAGQNVPVAQTTLATISKFMQWVENVGISIGKFFDMSKPKSLQIGWDIYDKYDTQIRNGLAAYSSAGIDANTTLEHHILTQTNTPSNTFHHVITYFYNDKTETSNRVQMAIPYKTPTITYHRYYLNGEWSEWLCAKDFMGDFIVAQGTSGEWEYRKWNSGFYECWATLIGNSTNYSTTTGLGYLHKVEFNYPITFAKRANPQANLLFGSGIASVCCVNSSYTNKVILWFDANLATAQYVVNLHVVGKWK